MNFKFIIFIIYGVLFFNLNSLLSQTPISNYFTQIRSLNDQRALANPPGGSWYTLLPQGTGGTAGALVPFGTGNIVINNIEVLNNNRTMTIVRYGVVNGNWVGPYTEEVPAMDLRLTVVFVGTGWATGGIMWTWTGLELTAGGEPMFIHTLGNNGGSFGDALQYTMWYSGYGPVAAGMPPVNQPITYEVRVPLNTDQIRVVWETEIENTVMDTSTYYRQLGSFVQLANYLNDPPTIAWHSVPNSGTTYYGMEAINVSAMGTDVNNNLDQVIIERRTRPVGGSATSWTEVLKDTFTPRNSYTTGNAMYIFGEKNMQVQFRARSKDSNNEYSNWINSVWYTSSNRVPNVDWHTLPDNVNYSIGDTLNVRSMGVDIDVDMNNIVIEYRERDVGGSAGSWSILLNDTFAPTNVRTTPNNQATYTFSVGNREVQFRTRATDVDGASSPWVTSSWYSSTNTIPTITWHTLPSTSATYVKDSTVNVRVRGDDIDNNLNKITIEVRSGPIGGTVSAWSSLLEDSFSNRTSRTTPNQATTFPEKNHRVQFRTRAHDSAGGSSPWLVSGWFESTNSVPSVIWHTLPNNINYSVGDTLNIRSTGNDIDIDLTRIVIEYRERTVGSTQTTNWSNILTDSFSSRQTKTTPNNQATYTFNVDNREVQFRTRATDVEGASSSWITSSWYSAPNTAPSIEWHTSLPDSSTEYSIGTTLNIRAVGTDLAGNMNNIVIEYRERDVGGSASNWTVLLNDEFSSRASRTTPNNQAQYEMLLGSREVQFRARALDDLSSSSPWITSSWYTTTANPPEVEWYSLPANVDYNVGDTIVLRALGTSIDGNLNRIRYQYRTRKIGEAWGSYSTLYTDTFSNRSGRLTPDNTVTFTFTNINEQVEFRVRAEDSLNNNSDYIYSSSYSSTNNAPTISWLGLPDSSILYSIDYNLNVRVVASDIDSNLTSIEYQVQRRNRDGSNVSSWSNIYQDNFTTRSSRTTPNNSVLINFDGNDRDFRVRVRSVDDLGLNSNWIVSEWYSSKLVADIELREQLIVFSNVFINNIEELVITEEDSLLNSNIKFYDKTLGSEIDFSNLYGAGVYTIEIVIEESENYQELRAEAEWTVLKKGQTLNLRVEEK